jgi:hypothetical protein
MSFFFFFGSYIKCLLFFIIGIYWSTCLTYIVAEVTHCKQADIDFRGHEEICAESGGVMDYEEDRSRPKRWFEKISYQSSIWSIILTKLIFYVEIGHKITYNCINIILVWRMWSYLSIAVMFALNLWLNICSPPLFMLKAGMA